MEDEESYLLTLPSDLLREYVLRHLDFQEIFELCQSNPILNQRICQNSNLIRELWKRDLSEYRIPKGDIYFQEYYDALNNIFMIGNLTSAALDALDLGFEKIFDELNTQIGNKIIPDLDTAARYGYLGLIKSAYRLSRPGGSFSGMFEAYRDRALIEASKLYYPEVIRFLIEHGATPNIVNDLPLREAFFHRDLDLITFLLEHGANPSVLPREFREKYNL